MSSLAAKVWPKISRPQPQSTTTLRWPWVSISSGEAGAQLRVVSGAGWARRRMPWRRDAEL